MLLFLLACGDPEPETVYVEYCPVDTAADDSGETDSGEPQDSGGDSGEPDSGDVDTGDGETGGEDTGTGDTGETGDTQQETGPCARDALTVDQRDDIATETWWCEHDTVTIFGIVNVVAGVTLHIEAGTTVLGTLDGAELASLRVLESALIDADGTADAPIVFGPLSGTSDAAEFDGIELFGLAPGSRYPAGDPADSSGVLRYVRVEGGGLEQAVHLDSVGTGTVVEYVSVSTCEDDAFEFDGGTVEASHLVVEKTHDDGIQYEDGFQGSIHHVYIDTAYGAGVTTRNRDPDEGGGTADEPRSNAIIYNITVGRGASQGVYYDNGGLGEVHNLLLVDGGDCAFQIDDSTWENGGETEISVVAAILGGATEVYCASDSGYTMEPLVSGLLEVDPDLDGYVPRASSPALDPANADTAYADYVGAFDGVTDWTEGWAWR